MSSNGAQDHQRHIVFIPAIFLKVTVVLALATTAVHQGHFKALELCWQRGQLTESHWGFRMALLLLGARVQYNTSAVFSLASHIDQKPSRRSRGLWFSQPTSKANVSTCLDQ
jgi:hypothetical protein